MAKPPSASIIARSEFTPFAGLDYQDFPAISFQCHPEFEPEFAAALYAARRGASLTETQADAAVASLAGDCDRRLLAEWIASFLRANTGS
jgi:GMP synthase-like glutamine amidotransferase